MNPNQQGQNLPSYLLNDSPSGSKMTGPGVVWGANDCLRRKSGSPTQSPPGPVSMLKSRAELSPALIPEVYHLCQRMQQLFSIDLRPVPVVSFPGMKNNEPYPVNLVTELRPDGTMEAVEVIEVPVMLSIRVKFLFGVRTVVITIAQAVLAVTEWIVDITDRWTLRFLPPQLIDNGPPERDPQRFKTKTNAE